jgi:hypothetical protein
VGDTFRRVSPGEETAMSVQQRETKVFAWAHVILLCVVLVGFGRSFYLRSLFLTSVLPDRLVIHGVALTLWFVFVAAQALLIQSGNRVWHRRAAWLAVPVVAGVVVTGFWVTARLLATLESANDGENMFIWTDFVSLLAFTALVAAAVVFRRQHATHRRLILFASILITAPALGRIAFWPVLHLGLAGAPIIALGGMAFLAALVFAYDLAATRRLHRASLWGLAGIASTWIIGTAIALSGIGFALTRGGG